MLAELAELGMQLARATAARALADLAAPDPPEEEPEAPQSEPQAAEPAPEPAQAATPRRAAAKSPGTTSRKPTDPVTAFIRLATAVCEIIALEAGLTASPTRIRGNISPALRADPRRVPLLEAFRDQTAKAPDRGALGREAAELLDEDLTADPEQLRDASEFFFAICEELSIEINYAIVPDLLLGCGPVKTDADYPPDDPIWQHPPRPCATSPP